MTRAERVQRAESTLREVLERIEAGRLWASDLDRLASAPVLDDFTADSGWSLRDATSFETVAEVARVFRAHVPIYVARGSSRVVGVVLAVVLAVTVLVSRTPLCAVFCLVPLFISIRTPAIAVSRAMVVWLGRAIEPRAIAGVTVSFDARFTFLVLHTGERLLIAPGEFVQALREIGVERV